MTPLSAAARRLADYFLHVSHIAVILFSAFGWLFPAARPAHLGLQALVLFSWFGLGSFKGWTNRFLTDIHWWVKRSLQQPAPGDSYVKLLVYRLRRLNLTSRAHPQ
jgi:hypothetical protein